MEAGAAPRGAGPACCLTAATQRHRRGERDERQDRAYRVAGPAGRDDAVFAGHQGHRREHPVLRRRDGGARLSQPSSRPGGVRQHPAGHAHAGPHVHGEPQEVRGSGRRALSRTSCTASAFLPTSIFRTTSTRCGTSTWAPTSPRPPPSRCSGWPPTRAASWRSTPSQSWTSIRR